MLRAPSPPVAPRRPPSVLQRSPAAGGAGPGVPARDGRCCRPRLLLAPSQLSVLSTEHVQGLQLGQTNLQCCTVTGQLLAQSSAASSPIAIFPIRTCFGHACIACYLCSRGPASGEQP